MTTYDLTQAEPAAARQTTTCIACGAADAYTFFELPKVPVLCNAPTATLEAALAYPTGHISLAFCPSCGHVFNAAFSLDLLLYDQQYENSLHFSPLFDSYIQTLGRDLVSRHDLHNRDIVEIGCGKGDFLALLAKLGNNRCAGYDPSFEPDREGIEGLAGVEIIREYYSEAHGDRACDFLACRQTLEHIPQPLQFLASIRRSLEAKNRHAVVFFEVPNVLYTLQHGGIWDIIYEHVSFFWAASMERAFAQSGFRVTNIRETFGGQYLCLEAVPAPAASTPAPHPDLAAVTADVRRFAETFARTIAGVRSTLIGLTARGQRAAIWGAGSKGVTFLNLFREFDSLVCAVDINPHKQGKFIPGSGTPIVPPEQLAAFNPGVVFLMNPLYRDEVSRKLASLGVSCELISI